MKTDKRTCYDFRIIKTGDNTEVIDETLKTPIDSIDGIMAVKYQETQEALDYIHRKEKEKQIQKELKSKLVYRVACFFGLITAQRENI